jgi:hypothetical protein
MTQEESVPSRFRQISTAADDSKSTAAGTETAAASIGSLLTSARQPQEFPYRTFALHGLFISFLSPVRLLYFESMANILCTYLILSQWEYMLMTYWLTGTVQIPSIQSYLNSEGASSM